MTSPTGGGTPPPVPAPSIVSWDDARKADPRHDQPGNEVHSWHINPGNSGDVAIHLLTGPLTSRGRTIIRSVLIDGGEKNNTSVAMIRQTVKAIRLAYNCDQPTGEQPYDDADSATMRFDTIVISHWDDDHYGGVAALLQDDIENQLQKQVIVLTQKSNDEYGAAFQAASDFSHGQLPDQSAENFQNQKKWIGTLNATKLRKFNRFLDPGKTGHIQSRYMKYDPGANPNIVPLRKISAGDLSGSPALRTYFKTIVYAPYQDVQSNAKINSLLWWSRSSTAINYQLRIPETPRATGEKGKDRFIWRGEASWNIWNLCNNIEYSFANYIGIELFSNRRSDPTNCTNPGRLAAALAINAFGFFIVAGDQRMIGGRAALVQPDLDPSAPLRPVRNMRLVPNKSPLRKGGHVINSGASGQIYTVHNETHSNNAPSLICILLFRTNGTSEQTNHRVVHYTAGDALFDVEGAMASWLTNGTGTALGPWRLSCPLMKLSHHGATESTPVTLLQALDPQRIIVSNPGSDTFGHPRPEVSFMLAAWYEFMKRRSGNINLPKPLYALNYPYYFIDPGTFYDIQSLSGASTEAADIQFVHAIKQFYQLAGKDPNDTLWEVWLTNWTTDEAKAKWAETSWPICSGFWRNHWSEITKIDTAEFKVQRAITAYLAVFTNADLSSLRYLPAISSFISTSSTSSSSSSSSSSGNYSLRDLPPDLISSSSTSSSSSSAPSSATATSHTSGFSISSPLTLLMPTTLATAPSSASSGGGGGGGGSPGPFPTPILGPPTVITDPSRPPIRKKVAMSPELPLPAIGKARLEVQTSAVPPANSPPTFMIFGTNFQLDSTDQNIASLDPNSPFNTFVNSLRTGFLTLDTKLSSATTPCNVSTTDAWFQSLHANTLGISSMSFSGTVSGQTVNISNISVNVNFLTASNHIVFSTQTRSSALSASGVASTKSSPGPLSDALLPNYNLLVLGLDKDSSPSQVTTSDLLSFFNLPWLAVAGSLPCFENSLVFTFDNTSANPRTGIFFNAALNEPTWIRMQLRLVSASQTLTEVLPFLTGMISDDALIHCKRMATCSRYTDQLVANSQSTVTLEIPITSTKIPRFTAWLTFSYDILKLVLVFPTSGDGQGDDVFEWLADQISLAGHPSDLLTGIGKVFKVHQVAVNLTIKEGGKSFDKGDISVTFEIDIFSAVFQATLSWPNFRISADIWNTVPPSGNGINFLMLPEYEEYSFMSPALGPAGTGSLTDIAKHVSGATDVQVNVSSQKANDTVWSAHFEAWKDDNGAINLVFIGKVQMTPTKEVPTLNLDLLSLTATYTGSDPPDYRVSLEVMMTLYPRNWNPETSKYSPCNIDVRIGYFDPDWSFSATMTDLQFAVLYDLFDSDSQESVMDVLQEISIPFFSIEFDLINGKPHFLVDGALRVHTLELDLAYEYWSSPDKKWQFQAQLGTIAQPSDPAAKIKLVDLIREFDSDSSVANTLAEVPFVRDIAIPSITSTPDTFEDAPIQLAVMNTGSAIVMWFQLEIDSDEGALSFLFVQYQPLAPTPVASGDTEDTGGTAGRQAKPARPTPKRLLRVQLHDLPQLPAIPLVGSIGQPVDAVEYVLVLDSAADITHGATAGFTQAEMDAINATLHTDNQLHYRNIQSTVGDNAPSAAAQSDNFVLLAGHHFILVVESRVVVDYLFGAKSKSATSPAKDSEVGPDASNNQGADATSATDADSGSTVGACKKSFGPFSIQNIGLQCKNQHLYLLMDATVAIGPITMTFVGFGIGFPLSVHTGDDGKTEPLTFTNLKDLRFSDFDVKLSGLDVSYNAPPVMIAGFFEKVVADDYEAYLGGLCVSLQPYTLLAVGEYRHNFTPDFKSIFVFARLDGPLLTLEFAEISGVEAGFGYNYELRLPAVGGDVLNFPLTVPKIPTDPMVMLSANPSDPTSFANWLTPKEQAIWFAIGFKVDAFQVLSVLAVAVVALSPLGCKIAIVGIASASLPPSKSVGRPDPATLLYVEMAFVAALDISGGSLSIAAQLTPNSYFLSPSSVLTGGFALNYWYGRNLNAGDFVFSVGGYHPAFKGPSYYPAVPRLGMSWTVIYDCLNAHGEAFFAVSPKLVMAGGHLWYTYSMGPIYAVFEVWMSFLANFKPFFLIADFGVSITVGFHLDLWLVTIDIHAEIDATLHLQGPPFAGYVDVNLWIHNFRIDFGHLPEKPPLGWNEFLELVRHPGPANSTDELLLVTIVAGSANDKTTTSERKTNDATVPWAVRAGPFQFRVESKFPIGYMTYGDGIKNTDTQPKMEVYSRPMQMSRVETDASGTKHGTGPFDSSKLTVTIVDAEEVEDRKAKQEADTDNLWRPEPIIRFVPKALWGEYTPADDPLADGDQSAKMDASSSADSTVPHIVGFTFSTPKPQLSDDGMPQFKAADAMQEGVFQDMLGVPSGPLPSNKLFKHNSIDERPRLPPTPPVQTTDLAAPRPLPTEPDAWDQAQAAWLAVDEAVAVDFVADWSQMFGWPVAPLIVPAPATATDVSTDTGGSAATTTTNAAPSTTADAAAQPPLSAKKPNDVISNIGNYYLGAPFLSVLPVATPSVPVASPSPRMVT